jgi:YD repeat-containing protein
MSRRLHFIAQATALGIVAMTIPGSALSSGIAFGYDKVGRLMTAHYDNGACIVYVYDANGNRASQTITSSGSAPGTPSWGTGTFGCFYWTP